MNDRPGEHAMPWGAAASGGDDLEATIVLETFNRAEGGSGERLLRAVGAALELSREHGSAEVVVADSSGDPTLAERLAREAPAAGVVEAPGASYDAAKMLAASCARGRYVLFLDGDCLPEEGWLDAHLAALSDGIAGTGGFTVYEGGFLAALETVMDFGFLLPPGERDLDCYASNNSGFRREALASCPVPDGPLRCGCYHHAQLLKRRGTPVRMTPRARALHECQSFLAERLRQGFDRVAACWADPELAETPLLRLGPLAAPAFYARELWLDWRRVLAGRRALGLSRAQAALGMLLFPLLRLPDLAGMLKALMTRRRRGNRSRSASRSRPKGT